MKKNFLITAAAFSFILNVAFVTIWSVHFFKTKNQTESVSSQNINFQMPCALHRTLGVTDSQWQQIRPELESFSGVSKHINDSIDIYRYQLIEYMSQDSIDTAALALVQEQILHLQKKLQQQVITYMLSEKKVFTPEQQKQLYKLIRARWFSDSGKTCVGSHGNEQSPSCGGLLHK